MGLLSARRRDNNSPVAAAENPKLSEPRAYLLAAVCLGSALLARLVLDPLWGDRLPYVTFFAALLIVTQFAGIGPSLLAVLGGFLLADWFFEAPRHSFLISDSRDQVNTLFYFLVCSVTVGFSLRARRAQALERNARARLSQLAAIIESSDDAVIGTSLDGNITSWNAAATRLYGYTEAEAVGRAISLLVPPDGLAEHKSIVECVGRGEKTTHFETVRRRRNGELVPVSLSVSPVRNSAGEIVGASAIARDHTERNRAERERESLVEQLKQALAEVKTLGGLLPICAHCKKIRDDKGYWNQIELYIRRHSNANFTHSVCPECARHHYPELYLDDPQGR